MLRACCALTWRQAGRYALWFIFVRFDRQEGRRRRSFAFCFVFGTGRLQGVVVGRFLCSVNICGRHWHSSFVVWWLWHLFGLNMAWRETGHETGDRRDMSVVHVWLPRRAC